MNRIVFFAYGVLAYLAFFITILYAIGFIGGFGVPKGINDGLDGPLGAAIAVNLAMLGAFAVQHTIMARPAFKRRWTTIVPRPIERSTFVLFASALLLLLFWQWRPMPETVWQVESPVVRGLLIGVSLFGWAMVFYSSFLIDHFDLFGLRQVYLHLRGREYVHRGFVTPSLYRVVRNPLMLGFIIAFWSTPHMTRGHLFFAVVATLYILVGIRFEERDIARILGEPYRLYRKRTPMLIPLPIRASRDGERAGE